MTNLTPFDKRPSGIESVGDLPWGSHFCLFYASQRELFDLLVPFIKAGLERNERCTWEIGAPLTLAEAKMALSQAISDFEKYESLGQIEYVLPPGVLETEARADESIESRLDQAILAGFDGLRLSCDAGRGKPGVASSALAKTIRRLNVIAAVSYRREELGTAELLQVVQDYSFALICNSGQWEIVQGSEVRTARDALDRSEEKLKSLFKSMSEGFAYHRIVLDDQRRPCDYIFLEVSPAFERLTGLVAEQILGKRVTHVLPGIEHDPTDWIGKYGQVALTGEPVRFESHAAVLDKWYAISAFSQQKGYFAVTFADITERKRAEARQRAAEERLRVTLKSIGDAVIATDIEGRVTLMNRVAETLTGWSETEARGMPLGEVFSIIDEVTGAVADDPVRKVIEQGGIVGLANHTVLIAKDGRRIAIADSAAPVLGDELLGVVLVFRDVSVAREAEQERDLTIEFLRLANENAATADLIRATVAFFQEQSGCEAVGIRLRQGDDYPYFEARGFPKEFLRLENELCARDAAGNVRRDTTGNPVLECMCGNVICGRVDPAKPYFSNGGSFWENDTTRLLTATTDTDRQARTRNRCNGEGYESVALVPLRVGSTQLGLLQFNDRRKGMFTGERIALWERLASHLAVALARSLAEAALQDSELRLRTLGDQIPSGAVYQHVQHPDGRVNYAYMSAGIESLVGVSVEDILADPASFRQLILEEDLARVAKAEEHSARDLSVFDCEFRQRTIAGEIKWVQCRSKPHRREDGSIVWDGIVVDITDRKVAEEALRQSEEKYRDLFQNMAEEVHFWKLVYDAQGKIKTWSLVDANPPTLKTWGKTLEEIRGKTTEEIFGTGATEHYMPVVQKIMAEGTAHSYEDYFPNLDKYFRFTSIPLDNHFITTGADITEIRKAIAQIEEANARLLEADQRKNEFLAILSHELRNPLTPIRNSLYILNRASPGSEQAKRAQEVIERQTGQLARLVNDLLDVTRVSRNKIELQRRSLDLNDLVRRTVDDHRSSFERRGIHLEAIYAAERLSIDGDEARLAQVIGNLLHNAAKFTPTGGRVTVSTAMVAARGRASLWVVDTGTGMDPAMLRHLFQPFTQADATLDRSQGGLGLGLALVKGLVELHGGEVCGHSDGPGKGAEFVVELPLDKAVSTLSDSKATGMKGRRRRVLIIEDNVNAANSLREALELGEHLVEVASNGPDGLALAHEFKPEVAFCDIGLPGMDGYEVARMFRADDALRDILLVALSGYALPEDLQLAWEAGFARHIAKPPSLEQLEEMLTDTVLR